MPFTLKAPVLHELVIKKSRFLACVQPVADRVQAQTIVNRLRGEHPGATHVCWALMAGGQSAAVDDGEPSGTAGRPMLEVLRRQNLDGVLATVVRYFGGVKLGAGGLVRAYTDAIAQALLQSEKVPVQRPVTLMCTVPYALEGWLRRELKQASAEVLTTEHGSLVAMRFNTTDGASHALIQRLNDGGQGQLIWLEPGDTTQGLK